MKALEIAEYKLNYFPKANGCWKTQKGDEKKNSKTFSFFRV
jgi:hypothetical protein